MTNYSLYPCFTHWLHGGQIYFYSDPHFGDEYNHAVRPNNVDDETQVANINAKVGKNDTIIILGDVGDPEWVKKLRGYKVLITGNHDAGNTNYQRRQCTIEIPCDKYLEMSPNDMWRKASRLFPNDSGQQEQYVAQLESDAWKKAYTELKANPSFVRLERGINYSNHSPFTTWTAYYDNKLFDEVYNGPLTISSQIILSHEPIVDYPFAFNIHGHDHGKWCQSPFHYNMCAEHINYTPVSLKNIARSGILNKVPDIHRSTIDRATERAVLKKLP